ncbi:Usherin Usher syndrome type IIa protein-like protein [Larimichthys crocea]|uniref:Usherin Usher syndrome type IIa protein-like protein n=1 Tax=Larimichthys crocea TaxID=215358 RepID=A0A0F8CTU5_LARCR|nr:Usherin Usher syndrome type IIa protein-like protein [Larimichthys crocea]
MAATMPLQRGAASTPATGRTTDPSTDSPSPTPPGGGGRGGSERAEGGQGGQAVVRELWFIVVMTGIALLLLAIILCVMLHRALNKPPFTRERPPLVAMPMQKRSPRAVYPPSNSMLFDTVPDTTAFSNSVTLKGFTMKIEEVLEAKCEPIGEVPPQGELGILSVNSLRRSVSQVMDGKSLTGDDEAWDPNISGHDSGMFMDDEEFVDTVKGFSTVRKEHTMFTDTNL